MNTTRATVKPVEAGVAVIEPAPTEKGYGIDALLRAGRTETETLPGTEAVAQALAPAQPEVGVESPAPAPLPATKEPGDPVLARQQRLAEQQTPFKFPRWMLWFADLLLVGMAALLVFKSPLPLQTWELVVCVSAVVFGALLALAAVLFTKDK